MNIVHFRFAHLIFVAISSLLQAVIDHGTDKDKIILAKFLDDEFNNLRVIGDSKNDFS